MSEGITFYVTLHFLNDDALIVVNKKLIYSPLENYKMKNLILFNREIKAQNAVLQYVRCQYAIELMWWENT